MVGKQKKPKTEEHLLAVLKAFIEAPTLDETRRVLDAHPELLGEEVDAVLIQLIAQQETEEARNLLEGYRAFLARCREVGADQAFSEQVEASEDEALDNLLAVLKAFIDAPNWDETRRVLDAHPELLGEEMDALLVQLIAQQETEEARTGLARHRALLARCREVGADQAFDEAMGTWSNISAEFADDLRQALEGEQEYARVGDLAALDAAISAWEHILAHPAFSSMDAGFQVVAMNDAGSAFRRRYRASGHSADLDRALDLCQRAVELTPPGSRDLPSFLNNLGKGLRDRYGRTGVVQDLEEAIQHLQRAVELTPADAPDLPNFLNNLGNGVSDRYDHTGEFHDLEEAIKVWQRAVELTPPDAPDLPAHLNSLGKGLNDRYNRTGELHDLEEAIQVTRRAVELTPPGSRDLPSCLNNLGKGLRDRYGRTGVVQDLEEAIQHLQRAVELTPSDSPYLPMYLNSLGNRVSDRYDRTRELQDMEEAIQHFQRAVELTPPGSPDLSGFLNNLGKGLNDRYNHTGVVHDLEEAIKVWQRAVELTPPDAPDLPAHLNNVGRGLNDRYNHTGELHDLEEAIQLWQRAVELTPPGSPYLAACLNSLGHGLRDRYNHTGVVHDLEEAIQHFQRAFELTPPGSPDLPSFLNNLGIGLRRRYNHTGVVHDLEEAIQHFQRAFELTPADSPYLPMYLNSLGNGLSDRFSRTRVLQDLEEELQVRKRAVELTPPDSPSLPIRLNNLGNGLRRRYERTGRPQDLEEAIQVWQRAVELTPPGSPYLPSFLNSLGGGLRDRFDRTGQLETLEEAKKAFGRSCDLALDVALEVAVVSARSWGNWALERSAWAEADEAYTFGRRAISELFKSQLDRAAKESRLQEAQGLPANHAYALARLGQLTQAIETLEMGRTRLLAEALEQSRRDLEQLPALGHGDLLTRYRQAADRILFLQVANRPSSQSADQPMPATDFAAQRQAMDAVRSELAAVVAAIREVPGYEDFLLPPSFAKVQAAVSPSVPLVYLVATAVGGVALILYSPQASPPDPTAHSIELVWLDEVTDVRLRELLMGAANEPALDGYLGAYYRWQEEGSDEACHVWLESLETTTRWLWDAVMGPLTQQLAKIAHNDPSVPGDDTDSLLLPSFTLVATGLLGLLPLHAAGQEVDGEQHTALDDFIVSYVPGAQALSVARTRRAEPQRQAHRLLAVVNPSGNLPFTGVEAEQVSARFPGHAVRSLIGPQATQEALMQALPGQTYLHFACHGAYNPVDVLHSSLILAQGNSLELREILEPGFDLSATRLVTLSACETGLTEFLKVPDETVGLPAGFLQAGAPAVVSSLWAVNDFSTSLLMAEFYRRYLSEGQAIAQALRGAQLWLRELRRNQVLDLIEPVRKRSETEDPVLFGDINKLYFRLLQDMAEDAYPFAHPYYWAAFTASGSVF